MSRGLEIPGQTKLPYVHHKHDVAGAVSTTVNTPAGPEIHTAGGYTRLEHAALEIAKQAAHGAAAVSSETKPEDLGVWAARAAFAMLAECETLEASAELRSAIET